MEIKNSALKKVTPKKSPKLSKNSGGVSANLNDNFITYNDIAYEQSNNDESKANYKKLTDVDSEDELQSTSNHEFFVAAQFENCSEKLNLLKIEDNQQDLTIQKHAELPQAVFKSKEKKLANDHPEKFSKVLSLKLLAVQEAQIIRFQHLLLESLKEDPNEILDNHIKMVFGS